MSAQRRPCPVCAAAAAPCKVCSRHEAVRIEEVELPTLRHEELEVAHKAYVKGVGEIN